MGRWIALFMRRWVTLALISLPFMTASVGCGITDRQLQDFAYSTGVRVFVQTIANIVQAAIVQQAQSV